MPQSLHCPNCGAPLGNAISIGGFSTCAYCNSTFRISDTPTPEPSMGDLLLGADFNKKPIPGWTFLNEDKVTLVPSPTPELVGNFPAGPQVYYVLRSSGWFDNIDASVTIRFLEGDEKYIDAGLFLRYTSEQGGYGFFISAQQTYQIGYYIKQPEKELEWKNIINWTEHSALKGGVNQSNRLRVLAKGSRLSVYLNGVLATSFEDPLFQRGMVRLALEPTNNTNLNLSFSNLELRAAL